MRYRLSHGIWRNKNRVVITGFRWLWAFLTETSFVKISVLSAYLAACSSGAGYESKNSIESAFREDTADCAQRFQDQFQVYFLTLPEAEGYYGEFPGISHRDSRITEFRPQGALLECASFGGDPLAKYILGVEIIKSASSTAGITQGLELLAAAAARDETGASGCQVVQPPYWYRCASGLPEAHLYLARLYGDCDSLFRDDERAAFHVHLALEARVEGAMSLALYFVDASRCSNNYGG